MAIFMPLSIFTVDWVLIHAILLFVIGPALVGASFRSDFRHWTPFTIAFCASMLTAVFGYDFFKKIGIADILPRLLGQ